MKELRRGPVPSPGRNKAVQIWLADETVTISQAAKLAGVSYKTAWTAINQHVRAQKSSCPNKNNENENGNDN
jgi:hypothetical protein